MNFSPLVDTTYFAQQNTNTMGAKCYPLTTGKFSPINNSKKFRRKNGGQTNYRLKTEKHEKKSGIIISRRTKYKKNSKELFGIYIILLE